MISTKDASSGVIGGSGQRGIHRYDPAWERVGEAGRFVSIWIDALLLMARLPRNVFIWLPSFVSRLRLHLMLRGDEPKLSLVSRVVSRMIPVWQDALLGEITLRMEAC